MSLKADIEAWDGKSVEDIRAIYSKYAVTRGFLSRLVRLAAEPECEVGATWLVKHHLETTDSKMTHSVTKNWYACANTLTHWEARLHMLQCTPRVPVPNACVKQIRRFLDTCLTEENKFVRAWAFTGYCELAKSHPRYRKLVDELLDDGEQHDPGASVRARIRQLRTQCR